MKEKMADAIVLSIDLNLKKEKAFEKFVVKLTNWWPKEYTWSGQLLESINIDSKEDGKCYEIGPHNFKLDWGRIKEIKIPDKIVFTWQISPIRVPEPNPSKVSEIEIKFISEEVSTKLQFVHRGFSNHGNGWENYLEALKSEQGWPYILNRYKKYCEKE